MTSSSPSGAASALATADLKSLGQSVAESHLLNALHLIDGHELEPLRGI